MQAARTLDLIAGHVSILLPTIGSLPLRDVCNDALEGFKDERAADLSVAFALHHQLQAGDGHRRCELLHRGQVNAGERRTVVDLGHGKHRLGRFGLECSATMRPSRPHPLRARGSNLLPAPSDQAAAATDHLV